MTNRNLLSATLAVLLTGSCAMAEEHVATIRWSELEAAGKLETGEVIRPSAESPSSSAEELLIVNEAATPLTVHLATIDPTSISKFNYTVSGRVRYENVEQPGYLEMWSVFPDNSRYFSKTLSSSGPTGTIHGTSASREFILPFSSSVRSGTPSKLEINLVLPAQGKVWISPLKLSEFEKSEWGDAMIAEGAWWGNRTGSLMGAILGPLLGILGALVGTLSGWGRGKNVCIAICWSTVVFGVVCLITGFVALAMGQPYVVYYPPLLLGLIGTVVMGSILPTIRKRFSDIELRKMESMDVSAA
ncbi:MAG: hypothetical protein ACI8P0_003950 [Planctomycetaceae bacterium]|jgi:hypothetical protein